MPALYATIELYACVEYAVVVILILHRSRETVSEHSFSEGREGIDWVVSEEGSCRSVLGCAELVELVFRYSEKRTQLAQWTANCAISPRVNG